MSNTLCFLVVRLIYTMWSHKKIVTLDPPSTNLIPSLPLLWDTDPISVANSPRPFVSEWWRTIMPYMDGVVGVGGEESAIELRGCEFGEVTEKEGQWRRIIESMELVAAATMSLQSSETPIRSNVMAVRSSPMKSPFTAADDE